MELSAIRTGSALFHLLSSMFTSSVSLSVTGCIAASSDTEAAIVARYQAGDSQASIAKALGLGRDLVRSVLKRLGPAPEAKDGLRSW